MLTLLGEARFFTSLKNELGQDSPEYPQSEFTQEIGGQMKDIKSSLTTAKSLKTYKEEIGQQQGSLDRAIASLLTVLTADILKPENQSLTFPLSTLNDHFGDVLEPPDNEFLNQ